MTELRKPESLTPESLTSLFNICFESHELSLPVIAKESHTSPNALTRMRNGDFAKEASQLTSRRAMVGAAGSLFRICEYFELDFEACLEACGLPTDLAKGRHISIMTDRNRNDNLIVTEQVAEKFKAVVTSAGKLNFSTAVQLLTEFCEAEKGE